MKRNITLAAILFILVGCGKQYTCSCYDSTGNHTQDHVHRYYSKGEAKERCQAFHNTYNDPDGHCEIKD